MKIACNNEQLFELSEIQRRVLCNDIHEDEFEADIKRRLEYIVMHKYEQCFKRLKEEWDPKLAARGVEMIPTNKDAYAQLVFSQPDYKCRKGREAAQVE